MQNLASVAAFLGVTTLTALVAQPYLLRWLGKERFGLFRVLTEGFGFLALLEFGLGGSMAPVLAASLGRGDARGVRATMAAGMKAYARVSALMVAAGLGLAAALPWLTEVPPAFLGDLRFAALIQVAALPLVALLPFKSLVEARQQGYRVNLVLILQATVTTAASLALAYAGFGVAGQAAALALGSIAFYAILAGDGVRRDPGVLAAAVTGPVDVDAARALRQMGGAILIIQLAGRVSYSTDNLVIGRMLGPSAVAVFFVAQRLPQLAQTLLLGVGNATWAGLAELLARGDRETHNRRVVELTGLVAVLAVAGLMPIAAYNERFIALWAPRNFAATPGEAAAITAAASLNALLFALASLWCWSFTAAGEARKLVPVTLASTAVNFAASVALTWRFGLVGPLLGTASASLLVQSWYLPRMLRREFGIEPAALAAAVLRPLAWGVPYGLALWYLARAYPPSGWIGLAAAAGASCAGSLALSYLAVLDPAGRRAWRARLASALPSRGVPDETTTPVG